MTEDARGLREALLEAAFDAHGYHVTPDSFENCRIGRCAEWRALATEGEPQAARHPFEHDTPPDRCWCGEPRGAAVHLPPAAPAQRDRDREHFYCEEREQRLIAWAERFQRNRDALRGALADLSDASDRLRPEPMMSGPKYRTIGPVSAQRAHEAIERAIRALATEGEPQAAGDRNCITQGDGSCESVIPCMHWPPLRKVHDPCHCPAPLPDPQKALR